MLRKESKRTVRLHCLISQESKEWLRKQMTRTNRREGSLVDEALQELRRRPLKKGAALES